jgi:ATP-binding cassette subfamily B protein
MSTELPHGRMPDDIDADAGIDEAWDDDADLDLDDGPAEEQERREALRFTGVVSAEAAVRVGWRPILLVTAIGLLEAATIVVTAVLMRVGVDDLVRHADSSNSALGLDLRRLGWIAGGLAAAALFAAWVRMAEFSVSESIGYRYVERLRLRMYEHLQDATHRQVINSSTGGVLLRFMGDLTTIRTWVSRGVARGIVAGITILAGLGILAWLDPLMAPVALGILLVGAALSLGEGASVRRTTRGARRQRGNLATNLTDQVHALSVVQTMGRTGGERERFARQNARLTRNLLRYARVRGLLRGIATASGALAVVGVFVVGALDVAGGRASVGAVVAAMIVARQMVRPVRVLGLSHDYWQSAKVSREKIVMFLRRTDREASTGRRLLIGGGRIEFRDVRFAQALRGVSGEVLPGQVVAVTGPNGAGKSTLLAMVARLQDPDEGEVLVDDQPLHECTLRSCSARISIVSPALPLMRGSLRRNLLYRWRDAPEAELRRVVALCGVGEVIERLGGLDGGVKEGGENLSRGEAARVALARALVGNPKILLLDEPTNALDARSRARFHQALAHYGGTVLLATHDPDEAALADVVWRMEDGVIVEVIPGAVAAIRGGRPLSLPDWARAKQTS